MMHALQACRTATQFVAAQQHGWRAAAPAPLPAAHRSARGPPAAAASGRDASASYGLFICSGSPEMAEAAAAAGVDWLVIDGQHGAVPTDRLKFLLCAAASGANKPKCIVRVGGPTDRFGIQQALE